MSDAYDSDGSSLSTRDGRRAIDVFSRQKRSLSRSFRKASARLTNLHGVFSGKKQLKEEAKDALERDDEEDLRKRLFAELADASLVAPEKDLPAPEDAASAAALAALAAPALDEAKQAPAAAEAEAPALEAPAEALANPEETIVAAKDAAAPAAEGAAESIDGGGAASWTVRGVSVKSEVREGCELLLGCLPSDVATFVCTLRVSEVRLLEESRAKIASNELQITSEHRYSDFLRLHELLLPKLRAMDGAPALRMPPKRILKTHPETLAEREEAFKDYVAKLSACEALRDLPPVLHFLMGDVRLSAEVKV